LLHWYERRRRDLPWRNTRDPYNIWVSEVMLQQTRVQAAIPYYEKFLRLFPDVAALADADEQTLLACWSGLGYYSRARNLRKAARRIMEEFRGGFPRKYDAARELPGVGDYTARAVLSIAYRVPLAVVDGNVARVLSRLCGLKEDFRSGRGRAKYLRLADALLAPRRAGDFNQAMMELGATVCLPVQPRCPECPLRAHCRARKGDAVDQFPPLRRPAKLTARRFIAAVVSDDAGRLLLVRRPKSAKRLAGFWELPMWELSEGRFPLLDPHRFPRELILLKERTGQVRHSITTNQLKIHVHAAELTSEVTPAGWRWFSARDMERLPVTTITRKALHGRQAP
jgi:A/G-specific adenine glycosylase